MCTCRLQIGSLAIYFVFHTWEYYVWSVISPSFTPVSLFTQTRHLGKIMHSIVSTKIDIDPL